MSLHILPLKMQTQNKICFYITKNPPPLVYSMYFSNHIGYGEEATREKKGKVGIRR